MGMLRRNLQPAAVARHQADTELKQSTHYNGIPIEDPAAVPVEGMLVIAPYLHRTAIKNAAQRLGWPDDTIYPLQ